LTATVGLAATCSK